MFARAQLPQGIAGVDSAIGQQGTPWRVGPHWRRQAQTASVYDGSHRSADVDEPTERVK